MAEKLQIASVPGRRPCTLTSRAKQDDVSGGTAAVSWHGDEDTPELRMMIRASLLEELPRYESEYESAATD